MQDKMSTAITETHIDGQAALTHDKRTSNGIIRNAAETEFSVGICIPVATCICWVHCNGVGDVSAGICHNVHAD